MPLNEVWPAAAVVLLGLAALVHRRASLVGTTLMAPWWWTLVALLSLFLGHLALAAAGPADEWTSHLRYVAAVSTFCPLMAVLGAKRPQDRGWQFIVLSLWVVLALPAGQAWLHRPEANLHLHTAWRWFLAILVSIGVVNRLPTRYWPTALLTGLGQAALLSNHLPIVASMTEAWPLSTRQWNLAGICLWTAGLLLWSLDLPRRRPIPPGVNRLWLDFRDAFGVVWAMRVAERVNASSTMYGWGLRLGWSGFQESSASDASEADSAKQRDLERALRTLLRRFVSPEWISERLGSPAPAEAAE